MIPLSHAILVIVGITTVFVIVFFRDHAATMRIIAFSRQESERLLELRRALPRVFQDGRDYERALARGEHPFHPLSAEAFAADDEAEHQQQH